MKSHWLVFLISCSATVSAASADRVVHVHAPEQIDYIIPSDSPVRFESIGEYGVVTYSGQFSLMGHYKYGYVEDNPGEGTYDQLELSFIISDQEAKKLPRWSRDPPVRDIYIRNPDRFARQVIGAKILGRLHSKKIRSVEGIATLEVRRLQTSVECDHQGTSVEFVSLRHAQDRQLAVLRLDELGC